MHDYKKTLIAGSLAAALSAAPALAENGRFVMDPVDGGFIRMDTQTGAMSFCEARDGQLICKMAADERSAFNEDIAELQDRVEALENALLNGEFNIADQGLPDEEEFERGLGYMEQFMRRFMGIMREFEEPSDRT